jgi:hypothetical protein
MSPACTVVTFRDAGTTLAEARPGDNLNTIQWVLRDWVSRGFPADAAALTDIEYRKQPDGTWVIGEADLYLNGESVEWVQQPSASSQRDVLSVITHEAGHMLGLLHPCEPGGGDGAPDCASDSTFAESTLFPLYHPAQASLAADDVAGVCFLYPGIRCDEDGCPPHQQCAANGCRAKCGEQLCAANHVCDEGSCRPIAEPCVGEDCPAVTTCAVDEECAPTLRCVAGECVAGHGAVADACESARDCASGVCSANGGCMPRCRADADCGVGIACDAVCINDGKPLGVACASATDCAGGYCVAGLSDSPVCSRACGGSNAGCPAGWSCDSIDARAVCSPTQTEDSSCACALPGGGRSQSLGGHSSHAAFSALLLYLRRRLGWRLRLRNQSDRTRS